MNEISFSWERVECFFFFQFCKSCCLFFQHHSTVSCVRRRICGLRIRYKLITQLDTDLDWAKFVRWATLLQSRTLTKLQHGQEKYKHTHTMEVNSAWDFLFSLTESRVESQWMGKWVPSRRHAIQHSRKGIVVKRKRKKSLYMWHHFPILLHGRHIVSLIVINLILSFLK